jgi:hypothetical protein
MATVSSASSLNQIPAAPSCSDSSSGMKLRSGRVYKQVSTKAAKASQLERPETPLVVENTFKALSVSSSKSLSSSSSSQSLAQSQQAEPSPLQEQPIVVPKVENKPEETDPKAEKADNAVSAAKEDGLLQQSCLEEIAKLQEINKVMKMAVEGVVRARQQEWGTYLSKMLQNPATEIPEQKLIVEMFEDIMDKSQVAVLDCLADLLKRDYYANSGARHSNKPGFDAALDLSAKRVLVPCVPIVTQTIQYTSIAFLHHLTENYQKKRLQLPSVR